MRFIHGFLLIVMFGVAGTAYATSDNLSTIKHLSQMFSDASASGNAKVLDDLMDDHVVFMVGDGSIFSKHDIIASVAPPPKGVHNKLTQSNFHVVFHGNVAVTSFTDNATFYKYGHIAHDAFRSTEVWLKENGQWKMISSQTLEAPVDPPQEQLPVHKLDQYVGRYEFAKGHVLRVERRGNGLVTIGSHNKIVPLLVEVPDVMFRKNSPRTRFVFERDSAGHISGFNILRAGHNLEHFKRVKE